MRPVVDQPPGQGVGVFFDLGVGQTVGLTVGSTVGKGDAEGDAVAVFDGLAVGEGADVAEGEAITRVKKAALSSETVHGGTPAGP